MAGRSVRSWRLALAGSLLLHAGLFGGLERLLPHSQSLPAEPRSFDAQLVSAAAPVAIVPAPPPQLARATAPRSRPAPHSPPRPAPRPPADTPIESAAEAAAPEAPAERVETNSLRDAEKPAAPPAGSEAAPPPPPPQLNPLPPRLDLRFQVRYGLASGEQTLVWINDGERYTVTSVAAATGLTGMLYSGRFVQTSRGRITPRGLQPEEFWDRRGDRQSRANFDAGSGSLTLTPAKGEPQHFAYQGDVQDVLSLFFQLALTAPPSGTQQTHAVFNGKKLRDYVYEVRGEETLHTPLGALRTLHLVRRAGGDGRFEVWLAIDRHYLPARALRSDDKGNEMELRLLSIVP